MKDSLHLKNIFSEGELQKDSVTEKFSATAKDGKSYLTQFYSLDAIISVGCRVNSKRASSLHTRERTAYLAADYRYFCRVQH